MKIAMIGHKSIPSRKGGVEIHVEEVAKRLVLLGHEVTVYNRIYPEEKRYRQLHGIRCRYVRSINTKSLEAISATFFATMDAIFRRYDIIHFHSLGPSTFSGVARFFGKSVVCTIHGLDWQRDKWGKFASWYLRTGEKIIMQRAHRAVTVSEDLLPYFKETYGRDIDYLPNGVNRPVMRPLRLASEKFGLTCKGYYLFLARLVPEKGLHYLIEAFSRMKTDKMLVIAGDASHSTDYVKQIMKQSSQVPGILFTGFVEKEMLDELYANAYVYVLPSDVEGMPISLMEAMSYGCTCLVSDIPQNSRVICDLGYKFERGNVSQLTERLQYLDDHPELRFEENKLLESVLSRYNWQAVAAELAGIYKEILDKRRK